MAEQRTSPIQDFAIVGVGAIGGRLARQAIEARYRVAGFDPKGIAADLTEAGMIDAGNLAELRDLLRRPRIAIVYVPAGPVVDQVLDELAGAFEAGDIVVDGGNSYWGDSIRRHARLSRQGLGFVDLGTSGGLPGARHGACFMAGGEAEVVRQVEPVLKALAVEGGYAHCGGPGTGHFAKLVHNGIEFGMLQAIGEGVALLEAYDEDLPVADILSSWRHGSVIRGWLIDLAEACYRAEDGGANVPPLVEDTGEVNWLVDDALRMEVPIPVVAQSVMQLFASRDENRGWARTIAMMRHAFGGHPYGRDEMLAQGRRSGRVGGFVRPGHRGEDDPG